eukprot:5774212-Alexandrium_andersonii.AAC.1
MGPQGPRRGCRRLRPGASWAFEVHHLPRTRSAQEPRALRPNRWARGTAERAGPSEGALLP